MTGFAISFALFWLMNIIFPVRVGLYEVDETDVYGTFTNAECEKRGIISQDLTHGMDPAAEKSGAVEQVAVVEGKSAKFKQWLKG
jgi:hypothetical protein